MLATPVDTLAGSGTLPGESAALTEPSGFSGTSIAATTGAFLLAASLALTTSLSSTAPLNASQTHDNEDGLSGEGALLLGGLTINPGEYENLDDDWENLPELGAGRAGGGVVPPNGALAWILQQFREANQMRPPRPRVAPPPGPQPEAPPESEEDALVVDPVDPLVASTPAGGQPLPPTTPAAEPCPRPAPLPDPGPVTPPPPDALEPVDDAASEPAVPATPVDQVWSVENPPVDWLGMAGLAAIAAGLFQPTLLGFDSEERRSQVVGLTR